MRAHEGATGKLRAQAPAQRRRAPVRRPLSPAAAHLLRLQRQAGNRAVLKLLNGAGGAVIQRDADEVRVEWIVDRLQGAIKDDSQTRGDVHESFISVDVPKVSAALDGLTAAQGKAVEAAWLRRDKRPLRAILSGQDLGRGNDARLDPMAGKRLVAMLDGTVYEQDAPPADPWDPGAERRQVEARGLTVDVIQLGEALRDPKQRKTVFEILGRRGGKPGGPEFVALNEAYKQQWDTGLYVDFVRYLRGSNEDRAEALLEGRTQEATGIELQDLMARRYQATATPDERVYGEAIEARLEELRRQAGGDPDKLKQILGQQSAGFRGTIGEQLMAGSDDATKLVVKAITEGNDADVSAAKLARLDRQQRLKGTDIELALIDLRRKAIMAAAIDQASDVSGAAPTDEQRRQREQHAVSTAFHGLESAFLAAAGHSLVSTIVSTGSAEERRRNAELLRGMGAYVADEGVGGDPAQRRSAAFIELDLALESWQPARVRAVIAGMDKPHIEKLADEYTRHKHTDVRQRLYTMKAMAVKGGVKPKGSTLDVGELDDLIQVFEHGGVYTPARGGDRFDSLMAEGKWYWDRIDALYDRTMAARGLFAELRDWKGNLEHELVDLARTRAKQAHDAMLETGKVKSMKTGAELVDLVGELKVSYDRLSWDVDVYTEATKAAFTSFVDMVVTLVTVAISFTSGGAAAMLLRNLVGTVGTKLVLLQEDYTADAFIKDVLSQTGGALGGQVATSILGKGIGYFSQAAKAAGLRLSPEIGALATKGLGWAADQVGNTAGAHVATGGGLELPTWSEWMDAAALTLAHKGVGMVKAPKGAEHETAGGKAPGRKGAHEATAAPVIHDAPMPGVRKAAELPSGGQVKLLENGKVATCFSPCRVDDTMASQLQQRFERELFSDKTAEAQQLRQRSEELWARERAATDAGDAAAREALFGELTALNERLADYRNRRTSERTSVPLGRINELVRLAHGDSALVERFLHHTRNDPDRVRDVLAWAQGDAETLGRVEHLITQLERRWDAGGAMIDPRLEPFAASANMRHMLQAHSFDYFAEVDRPQLTGFWPKGTTRAQVEAYLVEAVGKLNASGFRSPGPPTWWQEVVRLDNGIMVQVGYNGGTDWLGQFFPIDGPGVYHVSLDELHAAVLTKGRY